jgi:hypothetical protein
MKKALRVFAAAAVVLAASATSSYAQKIDSYGKTFDAQKAITAQAAVEAVKKNGTMENVAVQGTISQVCQAEGCWMKIKGANNEEIFVKFKDHSFLVPKDIAGKNTIVYGTLSRKTVSVEQRRHLAEDAGATKEQIEAIKTPTEELRLEATGAQVM